jgi:endonuclease YncB( thermonuclease family)
MCNFLSRANTESVKIPGAKMKTLLTMLVAVLAVPLEAQWLNYPTPGIPRMTDGLPNLSAPTPRTADGKPDLSGVWDGDHKPPCPPRGCDDNPTVREFLDIGASLKGGLPYKPGMAELAKARRQPPKIDEPLTRCLPFGIVERHTHQTFRKIVQTPGLLVILNEYNKSYRQIFTDGRPLPDDPQPSYDGYSIGKWDGDTLVVTTTGFKDGIWLDAFGDPMTEEAKITERFHRVDFGHLEIALTVDDPKAYTKPWTVRLYQILAPDTDLIDYICLENEKDRQHMVAK